ncbi:MAG: glycosyltransferase, partial [Candidatus Sumerlaeaceae bacterium]
MIGGKLSIVHISTEKGWRGGEQQVKLLTDGLVARGHRCTVLAPPDSALFADRTKGRMAQPLRVRFGEVDYLAVRQIAETAKRAHADVLHAHTSHAHALGLLASRIVKKPLTVSRRVDFPVGGNWLSRRKYLAKDVHYIAISNAVKKVLIDSGIGEYQVSIAYSGIDTERFRPRGPQRDEQLAASWGAAPRVPLIVNVAALTDHKDHETLLHAARLLRDRGFEFKLVIAGTGELEAKLRQQQQESALDQHVTFAGFVKDVGSLLRAGDLFVMSSHLEGLCTSILDAMIAGLPVVATSAGGIPEIIADGSNGLLARPRDAAGLA